MTAPRKMTFDARVDEMRGRIKAAWGDLTDDDVDKADGRWDQMVATIREKTGESLETITTKINDMIDSLRDVGSGATRR